MSAIKVLAIDLYGTILDTSSIASKLQSHFPPGSQDKASKVVQEWRKYQLEYTWRLNSMDLYEPFGVVTRLSLVHALKENSTSLPNAVISELISSYNSLEIFPDTSAFLSAMPTLPDTRALIFSNGEPKMLSAALSSSSVLNGMNYVSVDSMKRYKPDPKTYKFLVQSQIAEHGPVDASEVYLVSGNPFDIAGAGAAGLGTIWVDRGGKGWCDGLGKPQHVVGSLEEIVGLVRKSQGAAKEVI